MSRAPWIDESPDRLAQMRTSNVAFALGAAPWVIFFVTALVAGIGCHPSVPLLASGVAVALVLGIGGIVMGLGRTDRRARTGFILGLLTPFAILLVSVVACFAQAASRPFLG